MKLSPTSFQSQMLWEFLFPVQVPRVWGVWCGDLSSHFFVFLIPLPMANCGKFVLVDSGSFSELDALVWLLSQCFGGMR